MASSYGRALRATEVKFQKAAQCANSKKYFMKSGKITLSLGLESRVVYGGQQLSALVKCENTTSVKIDALKWRIHQVLDVSAEGRGKNLVLRSHKGKLPISIAPTSTFESTVTLDIPDNVFCANFSASDIVDVGYEIELLATASWHRSLSTSMPICFTVSPAGKQAVLKAMQDGKQMTASPRFDDGLRGNTITVMQ